MGKLETEQQFETSKNLKALGITCAVTIAVFFIFLLIGWTLPQLPPAPKDEGVEVNLGNSDFGSGTVAPQIPGEQSEAQQTNSNPPPTARSVAETEKEVIPNNEPDATPVNTSPKPEKKKPKQVTNTITKPKPKAVINPTPTPPRRALAIYHGGKNTANGGNNADSYNNARNQGIASGNGDQGKPNGNPNSDSYTGNGGTGNGISIRSGLSGRSFTHLPSFTDNFNENAKVAVDITVDKNGIVTSASVNLRGTTTTNQDILNIATKKAKLLKLNQGDGEQSGTIVFSFKLQQ